MLPAMLPKGVMPPAPAPMGVSQGLSARAGAQTTLAISARAPAGGPDDIEFELHAMRVAKLTVGGQDTNGLRTQVIPAQRISSVILSAWGNTNANCQ